jgi:hypothetical protein
MKSMNPVIEGRTYKDVSTEKTGSGIWECMVTP